MYDAAALQTRTRLFAVRRTNAGDSSTSFRRRWRDQLHGPPIARPLDHVIHQPFYMVGDVVRSQLKEQLEARVHAREIVERERDELETPGVIAPGHVVVAQAPEIIRALRRHPAHDGR